MKRTLHLVDAFANRPFSGNPAAVCVLDAPGDEPWMQLVAREMNLSETAFLHPVEGGWSLRWFTPAAEVVLCGHATLAAAHVLWETGVLAASQMARFHTLSGWLTAAQHGELIELDFPAQTAEPCAPPQGLAEALGCEMRWVGLSRMDYLVEVGDEDSVRALQPNLTELAKLPVRGLIVTARSGSAEFDFVSRFFAPAVGVNEDPVTGSAHCTLGPYWQARLGKDDFAAFQASARGGEVNVGVRGSRVLLGGRAITMGTVEFLH